MGSTSRGALNGVEVLWTAKSGAQQFKQTLDFLKKRGYCRLRNQERDAQSGADRVTRSILDDFARVFDSGILMTSG